MMGWCPSFRVGVAVSPRTYFADLVQVNAGPIGTTLTALRAVLDSWLGVPQSSQSEGRVTLNYRFASEDAPPLRLRLKVEINSREHFTVFGYKKVPFEVNSRWFRGSAKILTYGLEELLGTKVPARVKQMCLVVS